MHIERKRKWHRISLTLIVKIFSLRNIQNSWISIHKRKIHTQRLSKTPSSMQTQASLVAIYMVDKLKMATSNLRLLLVYKVIVYNLREKSFKDGYWMPVQLEAYWFLVEASKRIAWFKVSIHKMVPKVLRDLKSWRSFSSCVSQLLVWNKNVVQGFQVKVKFVTNASLLKKLNRN